MKQALFLAVTWMTFSGFALKEKSIKSSEIGTQQATVVYAGDPAADGLGWVLAVSTDYGSKYVSPQNLPEDYMQDGMRVNVEYKSTGQYYPCRCRTKVPYVVITEITPNKEEQPVEKMKSK